MSPTGVRTYRDDVRGADRGRQTAFVVELDGLHTIHLGDVGHLLSEEKSAISATSISHASRSAGR